MSGKLIRSFGHEYVVQETLTDGSKVYNVLLRSADGPWVVLACTDQRSAELLAANIDSVCVDISLRDREEAA